MEHDFNISPTLRELLALKKQDLPQDTQIDQFLAEFHCHQRAQLLVPESFWTRVLSWVKERVAGVELLPSLSYAAILALITIFAGIGLSQQVQVTEVDGQSKLLLRMPTQETSFAMIPASFLPSASAPQLNDSLNFASRGADSTPTRYVFANNSHGAYDATVAF